MYMLTNNEDDFSAQVEWDNFAALVKGALLGEGESTQLFRSVDFVFTKLNVNVKEVTRCARFKNMQLLWVPPGPCDLCAHAQALQFVDAEFFDQLILMNSGVRGPFVAPHGAHWLDAVSIAGRSKISNSPSSSDFPSVVASPQLSWQNAFHPQSYLLSVPQRVAKEVLIPLWMKTCSNGKFACTIDGECAMGNHFLSRGIHVHSLGRNFTVTSMAEGQPGGIYHRLYRVPDMPNPTLWPQDPCASIFVKLGGDVWRSQLIDRPTIQRIQQLTKYLPRHDVGHDTFMKLLAVDPLCEWI